MWDDADGLNEYKPYLPLEHISGKIYKGLKLNGSRSTMSWWKACKRLMSKGLGSLGSSEKWLILGLE